MTKVAVIIPNYNNAHYLGSAIQSVLNQTFTDYEIIVVDDGSTDNSRDVVNAFGDKVRYVWQENKGLGGARNTGILASTAEFVGLLDADDEWKPDYLEKMMLLINEHPDVSVFYCMAQCMNADGIDLPQLVGGPPVEPDALHWKLLRANFIIPSTVTFRRKAIFDAGNFDASLRSCEDWDLWLRILPDMKIAGSSNCLVRYRVHGYSLSSNVDGMHSATKRVLEKNFGADDGELEKWTPEKRRAYGGVYRYQIVTFIQRQSNWDACPPLLEKALIVDSSLVEDIDFYYELVLGTQPVGHRGVSDVQEFDANALQLQKLIDRAFSSPRITRLKNRSYGYAFYALGLAAYNTKRRDLSRHFLLHAIGFLPRLLLDRRVILTLIKSCVHPSLINYFKQR